MDVASSSSPGWRHGIAAPRGKQVEHHYEFHLENCHFASPELAREIKREIEREMDWQRPGA